MGTFPTVPQFVRKVFRPFGASFTVQADDPRVFDACEAALAHFPCDTGGDGAFTLDVVVARDEPGDCPWPVTSTRQFEGGIEMSCGSGSLLVDRAGRSATARLPQSMAAIPDAVRIVVEGALSSLLIGAGVIHAVHSGLVTIDGHGLMLRGPSGAGKSTLTYACLRAGYTVCSDDWIYGMAFGRPDSMVGYPWRVFLMPDSPRHFPELGAIAPVAHPGADRWKLPIEPPADRQQVTAPLDAIVFLDPAPELDLRRIAAVEADERFWGPALPSERADLPIDWVAALLDRPCFVLQRGSSPDAAAALLQRAATSAR